MAGSLTGGNGDFIGEPGHVPEERLIKPVGYDPKARGGLSPSARRALGAPLVVGDNRPSSTLDRSFSPPSKKARHDVHVSSFNGPTFDCPPGESAFRCTGDFCGKRWFMQKAHGLKDTNKYVCGACDAIGTITKRLANVDPESAENRGVTKMMEGAAALVDLSDACDAIGTIAKRLANVHPESAENRGLTKVLEGAVGLLDLPRSLYPYL